MRKIIIIAAMFSFMVMSQISYAYTIGGAYAQLISCDWGKYGYEYGYIGTYRVNGEIYRVFFGVNLCQY